MTTEFNYDDWKDERLSDFRRDLTNWGMDQKYASRAENEALKLDLDRNDEVTVEVAGNELYSIQGQHAAMEGGDNLLLTDEGPYIVMGDEIVSIERNGDASYAAGRSGNFQATLYSSSGPEGHREVNTRTGEPGSAPQQVSGVSTYMWSEEPGTVSIVDSAMNEVEAILDSGKSIEV